MNSYITFLQFIKILHTQHNGHFRVYYFKKETLKIVNLFEGNLEQLKEFFIFSHPSKYNKYLYYQIDYISDHSNKFNIILRDNEYDF